MSCPERNVGRSLHDIRHNLTGQNEDVVRLLCMMLKLFQRFSSPAQSKISTIFSWLHSILRALLVASHSSGLKQQPSVLENKIAFIAWSACYVLLKDYKNLRWGLTLTKECSGWPVASTHVNTWVSSICKAQIATYVFKEVLRGGKDKFVDGDTLALLHLLLHRQSRGGYDDHPNPCQHNSDCSTTHCTCPDKLPRRPHSFRRTFIVRQWSWCR